MFAATFVAMFATRLWGSKRLMRGHIRWSTAFALRVFRVPVGLACVWWLMTRKALQFEVTPKGASDQRRRGRAPRVLWVLLATAAIVLAYSIADVFGIVPWASDASSTTASGVWLAMAGGVLAAGTVRISAVEFATSRRNAHRVAVNAPVSVAGVSGELLDISVGGASHEFASLRVGEGDWAAHAALSLWIFHAPDGAVAGLPAGVPLVGCRTTANGG